MPPFGRPVKAIHCTEPVPVYTVEASWSRQLYQYLAVDQSSPSPYQSHYQSQPLPVSAHTSLRPYQSQPIPVSAHTSLSPYQSQALPIPAVGATSGLAALAISLLQGHKILYYTSTTLFSHYTAVPLHYTILFHHSKLGTLTTLCYFTSLYYPTAVQRTLGKSLKMQCGRLLNNNCIAACLHCVVHCTTQNSSKVKGSAVKFSKVLCSAMQCRAVHCSAVQYSAIQCSAVLCSKV